MTYRVLVLIALAAVASQAAVFRVIGGAYDLKGGELEVRVSSPDGAALEVRNWLGAAVERQGSQWSAKMTLAEIRTPFASMSGGSKSRPIPGFVIETPAAYRGAVRLSLGDAAEDVRPESLREGDSRRLFGGKLHIERVPDAVPVAVTTADEDYPALAADPAGGLWTAWISYVGNGERLLLAKVGDAKAGDGGLGEPIQVNEGLGELYRPAVAVAGDGRVWVVWSEMRSGNWDLYARSYENGKPSDIERLTDVVGPDTFPVLARSSKGDLWLAWQGYRSRTSSDVLVKVLREGRWSRDQIVVGPSASNDWEPAIAFDSRDRLHVVWSSYRNGTHDIFLSRIEGFKAGPPQRLTGGDRLHIRPSIAIDAKDRAWVAYEVGAERWGKDNVQTNGGLHRERRIETVCVDGDRIFQPAQTFTDAQQLWTGELQEHVRLQIDGAGRLWAFYRINYMQRFWQEAAAYYSGSSWSEPIVLDRSLGRQAAYTDVARAADGSLWLAYPSDTRTEKDFFKADHNDVYLARIPAAPDPVELTLGAEVPVPAAAEKSFTRTWPEHRIRVGSRNYRLVWGELHKHTDIDHHGRPDGSLEDAYRYARDAVDLDFIATTDHTSPGLPDGLNPMTWWRAQKYADLFYVPEKFITLYGYESGRRRPQGHRNVIFPRRGGLLDSRPPGDEANDPRVLWQLLRGSPAPSIAIPHQLTDSKVDWTIHDDAFTPVMELYQSRRQNYEYDGAPQPPGVEQTWGKNDGSWAWDALAMGRKVGFIASTDHMSSHMAYAAAYAEETDRESVFRALQQRHTYAASDNIVVDFRLSADGREYLMGEEARISGNPAFDVHVIGTGPIAKVEIIRGGRFVWTQEPGEADVRVSYADNEPPDGETYYYLRVTQADGNLAWSSPIWVRR